MGTKTKMNRKTLEAFQMNIEKADEWGPGCMTEYGWWEREIEDGIRETMDRLGVDRTEAMIIYFKQ